MGSFTATTSGGFQLPAKVSQNITLPSGLSFVDQGNGTALLSGKPAAGTGGNYSFTITAANNDSSLNKTQSFTLTVDEAPSFASAAGTTFTVGTQGTFTISTKGFPIATLCRSRPALPGGVHFHDNGNGTATLSGMRPRPAPAAPIT